jgi:hypothetical protein
MLDLLVSTQSTQSKYVDPNSCRDEDFGKEKNRSLPELFFKYEYSICRMIVKSSGRR